METKTLIRVLVVDDHPIVRRGLANEIDLSADMQVIGEGENGLQAVLRAKELKPDVILMDIVMPEMDGIEATKEILKDNPSARILVLTSFTEEEKVNAAIKAGALGYILKDRHPEEVLVALREVSKGNPFLSPQITRKLFHSLSKDEPEPTDPLTDREKEVLQWVALGTPNKQIALKIGLSESTIRAHVSNILGKLNLENRSQLVLYAVRNELVDLDSPTD